MKLQISILLLSIASMFFAPSADASPMSGRKTIHDTLGRGMQITYDVILNKEEPTVFVVNGNGRSDLDCYIYDENDLLVAKDNDETDACVVRVNPKWAGHFSFVIKNVGDKPNTYSGSIF